MPQTHYSGISIEDGEALKLGGSSSALSSPSVGEMYYNSTTGKAMVYQATGWSSIDGTAAGSLDGAYNGGATIAVDAADVIWNLSDSSNDYDFQIRNTSGATVASGLVVDSYAANSVFTDAISIITTGSSATITDAIDASDAGITNAINVGGNTIAGTTAVINFDSFDVDGSGNTTIGGTLGVTGAVTLTAGMTVGTNLAVTGTSTLQGVVVIDGDNAEQFLIRENADAADVLTIDTTQDAGDTTMLLTTKVTTGTGVHIDGSTITSGDAFKVTVAAATMTAAGAAISVVADGTEIFAVRDDGAVLMKGTAEGTTAASITTGDFNIGDGDLIVAGGEASITTDTAGNILTLENTETGATGVVMKVNHNSASPADNDVAFKLDVYADDDGATSTNISSITFTQLDVSAASDDAEVSFATAIAGTKQEMLCLNDASGADITAYYPVNIETTTADQLEIVYDASNKFGIDVDSDGSTTLTTTGTNADFEIASGTGGDITLDATGAIVLESTGITSDGTLTITKTSGNLLKLAYDGSNHFAITVANDGYATLTTTGTDADFEIATGTGGDIILDATGDIVMQAGGSDVTMDAPLNITVAGGSQLELIAAGSIKCVDSVANTTGVMTRTVSGGTTNSYEIVADKIILDSAGDIDIEAGGNDVNVDAPVNITYASGSQLELIAAGSIKCVDSVTNTTGVTTRTISGGTTNSYEIVADAVTIDSAGAIALESTGVTSDAGITVTKTSGSLFAAKYDASNHFAITVANDGLTTLTTVGTDADFEIATGTTGNITLDATGDIFFEAGGGDVNSDSPLNITVAAGSQLELIASGSIKCVDSVTDTTGVTTRTVSGGTTNSYEIVADAITLDSAGALALESTGVTSDAEITVTKTSGNLLGLKYDASNHFAITVANDGLTTLTTVGTDADFEIATGTTGNITLDATGDIFFEAGGGDVNSDSPLNITVAAGSQLELIASGSIKCVDSVTDTTGATTRTVSGGSANTYEIVATGITLDSGGNINLEATSTVAVTGALTVSTTSTLTGAVTCTAGVQSSAYAATATADGLTTAIIPAGTRFVTVTSAGANNIIELPSAVVGNQVTLYCAANGYELRTATGSNETINNVDSDGTNELAVAATSTIICICVAASTWVAYKLDNLGAVATAGVPDAA